MLRLQHGHYRPDGVVRSSIIEPYDIQNVSPVLVARHTIDPFIYGVRGPGPSIGPSSHEVAAAAQAVAAQFAQGKSAVVTAGGKTQTVSPGAAPPPGAVGTIVQVAQGLMTGQPVPVAMPGSPPAVAQPPGMPSTYPTNTSATATVTKPPTSRITGTRPTGANTVATVTKSPTAKNTSTLPTTTTSTATVTKTGVVRPTGAPSTASSRPSIGRRPLPVAIPTQKLISGFGDPQMPLPVAPPNPFDVQYQRAIAARAQGFSPSPYQAGINAIRGQAGQIFTTKGLAPVMHARDWAAENAGIGPFRRLLALWRQQ